MSLTSDRPTTATTDTTVPGTPAPGAPPALRRRRRALGVVATVAAVVPVWFLGLLAGADYWLTDSQGTARVDLSAATVSTLVVALLGWGVLALFEKLGRHGTRAWTVLAVLVVAASMVPVVLVEATTASRLAFTALHLVVGAVLIPGLVRARRA